MKHKITKKLLENLIKEALEEITSDIDTGLSRGGGGDQETLGKTRGDVEKLKQKRAAMAGSDNLDKAINNEIELAQHIFGEFKRILAKNPSINARRALMLVLKAITKGKKKK